MSKVVNQSSATKDVHPANFAGGNACWIDDTGRCLPHSIIEPTRPARHLAFTQLGLVEVCSQSGLLCVRWNVADVAFGGLVAAAQVLDDCSDQTAVRLEFFWGAWARQPFSHPKAAMSFLIDTIRFAAVEPYRGTVVKEFDPALVRRQAGKVKSAFESWDAQRHRPDGPKNGVSASLAGSALAFQHDRTESDLLVSRVGSKADAVEIFGADWARTAVGQVCDRSQPDYEFDERVCASYESVLQQNDIRYDHIRALIRRPDHDPIWVPYLRVLLPTRDRFGTPTVLSVTQLSEEIDIPFMCRDRSERSEDLAAYSK